MQLKTTIRYHFTLIKKGTIKKTIIMVGKDMKELEHFPTAGENVKSTTILENSLAVPPKKLKVTI